MHTCIYTSVGSPSGCKFTDPDTHRRIAYDAFASPVTLDQTIVGLLPSLRVDLPNDGERRNQGSQPRALFSSLSSLSSPPAVVLSFNLRYQRSTKRVNTARMNFISINIKRALAVYTCCV